MEFLFLSQWSRCISAYWNINKNSWNAQEIHSNLETATQGLVLPVLAKLVACTFPFWSFLLTLRDTETPGLTMWLLFFFYTHASKAMCNLEVNYPLLPLELLSSYSVFDTIAKDELTGHKCHTNAKTVTPPPVQGTTTCHDSHQSSLSHYQPLNRGEQHLWLRCLSYVLILGEQPHQKCII